MNLVRMLFLSSLMFIGACLADDQSGSLYAAEGANAQASSIDFDDFNFDEGQLAAYQEAQNITYEEPSWPVLKLQEFASWLVVNFPSILTVAAAAVEYNDAFHTWWEAHRLPLQKQFCAEYADYCKKRDPNFCDLHQYQLVQFFAQRFAAKNSDASSQA